MMVTIMFLLLLPKPVPNSKSADHVRYLERRLGMWKEGGLSNLINEKRFVKLMDQGKISAALRCIGSLQCGMHEVTPGVFRVLKEKHPEESEAESGSVLQGPLPEKLVEEVDY